MNAQTPDVVGRTPPSSGGPATIRILVADDHALYRRGLEAAISSEPDLQIVAEADSATGAVDAAQRHEPDVVLLEVRIGGQSGIDACTAIKMQSPLSKVLILSASDAESDLFKALLVGANGYLLKSLPVEQIIDSVRLAAAGEVVIPPPMASHLVAEFSRLAGGSSTAVTGENVRPLTEPEVEVLTWISRGKPNREIAETMSVSENTVKNHVRNIMSKLRVTSRTEAAIHAIRQNLIASA